MADWLIFELTQTDTPYVKAYLGYDEHQTGYIVEIDSHNPAFTNPRIYTGQTLADALTYITTSTKIKRPHLALTPIRHIRGTTKQGWSVTLQQTEKLPYEPAWLKTAGRI